jgi:hypothetical protein
MWIPRACEAAVFGSDQPLYRDLLRWRLLGAAPGRRLHRGLRPHLDLIHRYLARRRRCRRFQALLRGRHRLRFRVRLCLLIAAGRRGSTAGRIVRRRNWLRCRSRCMPFVINPVAARVLLTVWNCTGAYRLISNVWALGCTSWRSAFAAAMSGIGILPKKSWTYSRSA